jgi:processive 1,2-diacylglycerol beta-glucosyltransferase
MAQTARVVVVYALAGIGHQRAAEALAEVLRTRGDIETTLIDVLDYMPGWFRWLYPRCYMVSVTRLPWLWAIVYTISDWAIVDWITGGLRRWGNYLLGRRFVAYLVAQQPHTIIATHFLSPEIAGIAKRRGLITSQLWTVMTDYCPHRFWVCPHTERYFVGLRESKELLEGLGVLPAMVIPSGIPVGMVFEQPVDRVEICAQYELDPQRMTLLIMSGGAGMGPVAKIVRALLRVPPEVQERIQLIVVAGTNHALQEQLIRLTHESLLPVRVLGFTDQMRQLMAVADIVITKPGGLTVTEALVAHTPLVLFSPIWGQETGNARVLVMMGVARRLDDPRLIRELVERWMHQPQLFREVQGLCRSAVAQQAARSIAQEVRVCVST